MKAEIRLTHPPTLQANCGDFLFKIIELVTECSALKTFFSNGEICPANKSH
jgi:hypothetical protein